jgi:hypothetical protein
MYDICPKCKKATVERYPNEKSLGVCLNRECGWKEKLSDKAHCVVCFGELSENAFAHDGLKYFCKDCGIMYQFVPSEKVVKEVMGRS